MIRHLLCILTLTGFLGAQTSPEHGSLKFPLPEEQVRVAGLVGRMSLELEHVEGRLEVLEAEEPSRQIVFPWSALASEGGLELHLHSSEPVDNQVDMLFGGPGGDFYWEQEGLGNQETLVSTVPPMSWLTLWGSEPLVGYVVWKRNRRVHWIDQGERVFDSDNQGEAADYQVLVEGTPVALQIEIAGEGPLQVQRSSLLRPGVSLIANTDEGVTRAVWVATDLQSIGNPVLGTIRVDDPETRLEILDWTASDLEGNAIPVEVRIVRQR